MKKAKVEQALFDEMIGQAIKAAEGFYDTPALAAEEINTAYYFFRCARAKSMKDKSNYMVNVNVKYMNTLDVKADWQWRVVAIKIREFGISCWVYNEADSYVSIGKPIKFY